MLTGIDHIVILVRDLESAIADYRQLGFTVTPGGTHTGGATHNALISFADGAYFELIAFTQPDQPSQHGWYPRLARGEGLVDYCLASSGLAADAAAATAADLPYAPVQETGRNRPDGVAIAWRSTKSTEPNGSHGLPFAIEDVTPRDLRVPGGQATTHPLGVQRVAGLTVAVKDLTATSRQLERLLQREPRAASPSTENASGAMIFDFGKQWIEVIQPVADDSPFPDDNPLQRYLATVGQGPYEVVLSGEHVGAPGSGDLLTGSTHGARIRIVRS